ncbi:MAG: sensor domain-containing protein [Pyrinomonadaceae bacterium]
MAAPESNSGRLAAIDARVSRLSGQQYRNFIENLPVLFYAVDSKPPYSPLYVSPAFEKFGYPLDVWLNDPEIFVKVIHEDDREWVFQQTTISTQTGEDVDYEYRIIDAAGNINWVRDCGCLIRNEDGEVVCREGVMLDITDRKQTELALKNNEERYRNLFENANDIIYVHDLEGNYISINEAGERIFGYTREESLSLNMSQVAAPENLDLVREQLGRKIQGREKQTAYELECVRKDGSRLTLEVNSTAIINGDTVVAVQGIARDITERKHAQEALRQSEANLAAAQRITHLGSWELEIRNVEDSNENAVRWSDEVYRIFGYQPKQFDVTAAFVYAAVHADDRRLVSEKFTEAVLDNKFLDFEARIILPDGSERLIHVQAETIYDAQTGKPIKMVGTLQDITERKRSEQALKESEARFRDLFENANDLIYTHDLKGFFTSLNRAGERITGYTRDEALTMNIADVVAPDSLATANLMTQKKLAEDISTTYEIDIVAKGGRTVSLELSTRMIYEQGIPTGVQGIGRDITERKRTERALKESETRYRQLGEGIFHQVWTAEPDGQLDYVNARTLAYFNRTSLEIIGEGWQNIVHPDDLPECIRRWESSVKTGALYETEFRLRRHDGVYRWHKVTATCSRDSRGSIVKWFGTNTDIEDQKNVEEKLNFYARHDSLTSLSNRAEFMSHLRSAVERANGNEYARFAVLFLDLDRFKVVNDSLGHVVGDNLLIAIADRLRALVRPGDIVARLGGDEFTILLNRTGGTEAVIQVAERVQRKLSRPFKIDNYEVFTSASIGIIVSDEIMRQPEDFLRDADSAMYRAKEAGKARYEVFDREMHVRNMNLLQIETDLRHAIERDEFEVLYQPIIELDTGSISEFEALIRWRHPQHGLITPDEFIGVAEETGLLVDIGVWVLEQSCKQIAKWQKNLSAKLSVSVNLSAKQLMHPSLTKQVKHILRKTGLESGQLKLEVTESTVMEHSERALSILSGLNDLGVSLSTDDFGTGYSSLSYLQNFPFDRLKIDRSFIDKMDDPKSAAIVKTILMLGENLDIEVVAEGVETKAQLEHLKILGCKYGQGYLFSRPVSAIDARKLITQKLNEADKSIPMLSDQAPNQILEATILQ